MTNKEKLIKIYNKALESGELESYGLCCTLVKYKIYKHNLALIRPINYEDFSNNSIHLHHRVYWANGDFKSYNEHDIKYKFTPLRQTILAFLIAMEE